MLLSSYRLDQFSDADGYAANVVTVLESYPEEVVLYVTDPRTGIQRACKWPPTIAEIVCACEVQMQHIAKLKRLQSPRKREDLALLGPPREERPTYEELKAKYGENWGLTPAEPKKPPVKAMSWQEVATFYRSNPDRAARLMRIANDYAEDRGEAPA